MNKGKRHDLHHFWFSVMQVEEHIHKHQRDADTVNGYHRGIELQHSVSKPKGPPDIKINVINALPHKTNPRNPIMKGNPLISCVVFLRQISMQMGLNIN